MFNINFVPDINYFQIGKVCFESNNQISWLQKQAIKDPLPCCLHFSSSKIDSRYRGVIYYRNVQ